MRSAAAGSRLAAFLGAALLAAACAGTGERAAPLHAFTALDGATVTPLAVPAGAIHVLVFVTTDCPIANGYAPDLAALARAWQGSTVRLFLVHVDPDVTAAAARAHAEAFALPGAILLDPRQELAAAIGASATPEAAVLTADGLRYRGRIDDRWSGLGERRQEPTRFDLREAVAAVRRGEAVDPARTEAVGCLLPEPAK